MDVILFRAVVRSQYAGCVRWVEQSTRWREVIYLRILPVNDAAEANVR